MSEIKSRLAIFLENQGIAKEKFYTEIGMTSANFRGDAKKSPLNSDAIENILSKLPQINPSWLITGEGKMLAEKDAINQTKNDMTQEKFFDALERRDKQFDELLEQNSRLISVIENMTGTTIKQSHVG